MLKLNLPAFEYKIKESECKLWIYDELRKKYVVLFPEEWVRQHFLHFLISEKGVSANLLKLEQSSAFNEKRKRCDIILYGRDLKPLMIVECKAPHIAVNEAGLLQLGVYNSGKDVMYLAITNGMNHCFYIKTETGYSRIGELPDFKEL